MSLATLKIEKYVDGFGNVVEPKIHYTDGTIRRVLKLNFGWYMRLILPSATLPHSSVTSNRGRRRVQPSSLRSSFEGWADRGKTDLILICAILDVSFGCVRSLSVSPHPVVLSNYAFSVFLVARCC